MSTRGIHSNIGSLAPHYAPPGERRNPSNLPPLPAGSILERGNVAQAAVDVIALGVWALLISAFAAAGGLLAYAGYLKLVS